MSRYYTPPKETGKEYVLAMHDFSDKTVFRLNQLPKKWSDDLLSPAKKYVLLADSYVTIANKNWVDPNDPLKIYTDNLTKRINELGQALKYLEAFDGLFERILRQEDLLISEAARMQRAFLRIVKAEQEANPELKDINISVVRRLNEYEYRSAHGDSKMRLAMTTQQRDEILDLEAKALKLINERLSKDRSLRKVSLSKLNQAS